MVHHVTWGKNTVYVFNTPATATATTPLTGTGPTSLFGTPATPSPTLAPAAPASSAGAFSFSSAPASIPQSPAPAFGGDDVDDDSSATTLGGHNDDHSDDNSDDDDDRSVNLLSPSQPAKWNREEDETGLLGLSNNTKANANANSNSTRVASPVKWSTTRTTTTAAAATTDIATTAATTDVSSSRVETMTKKEIELALAGKRYPTIPSYSELLIIEVAHYINPNSLFHTIR